LIDVDIWFWNDQIRDREDTREHKPYKIEDLMSGGYPQSNGYTCLYKVYEHVFEKYKNQEDLTIIIISDFEDNTVDWIENSQYNPNKNRHWQYLNVHIITREYERSNGFIRFDRLNKLLGVDNPSITAKILND
jgi:hypothetical protein